MLDIIDIRRDQVLMASSFPDELKGAFVGMERAGNPWQSTESRLEWAKPLPFPVPTVEENPDYEYLLKRGCQWLDEQARPLGADSFMALQATDREAIVSAAQASPERSLARVFFEATRNDALFFYYSDPASWPGLGFRGPPQPQGYADFTRSPTDRT